MKWGAAADQYLGRVLAGLPVTKVEFAVLPPHFKDAVDVHAAWLKAAFGPVAAELVEKYTNMGPVLIMCLASMVEHHDWLKEKLGASHVIFAKTPLYNNPELLSTLKSHLAGEDTNLQPSGVPPHIEFMKVLEDVRTLHIKTQKDLKELPQAMVDAMYEFLESRMEENGQLSRDAFHSMLACMYTHV